MIIIAQKIEK